MLKAFIVTGFITASLVSCDVRTKDKIADGTTNSTDAAGAKPAGSPTAATVQILDSVFDFGKLVDGETVEFSYRFKNIGTEPLIISNASASCGCTVPEKPEAPIKSGETGYIKVKFNSQGRVGITHKTVNVSSNASPAFPELVLKGEVMAKK